MEHYIPIWEYVKRFFEPFPIAWRAGESIPTLMGAKRLHEPMENVYDARL
jgi:hypothetical protein